MVAVNATILNGYRDFILPLSEQDEIVRNAVMAAASYHLGLRHPEWNSVALRYHMASVQGLSKRKDRQNIDKSMAYSNLSTMLLLLIEEMITSKKGKDFQILLRMIKSFIHSQGGEESIEQSPPGKFLIQQIRKMSFYSTPLISEQSARSTLTNISKKDLEFLYSVLESYPEHSPIILQLVDLIHKACNIYMARATDLPEQVIDGLVRGFISSTAVFNATSPGGHILIWPFFIVGAGCSQTKDREFVVDQLQHLWNLTGFANTLYAIEALRETWNGESGTRWTEVIAEKVEAFIM
ncbi:hypothetical protein PHISCL_00075 [Aspergillus sclerotialis]|uniref:C6 transcription factor n=1 Tax=Aspergillus sclerotialis TaxID=2070753 RepID=A0A3A2ZY41_9EURO|nr:hypothetical protein PHISCL_00075 [Aspergillus sclerotialis]